MIQGVRRRWLVLLRYLILSYLDKIVKIRYLSLYLIYLSITVTALNFFCASVPNRLIWSQHIYIYQSGTREAVAHGVARGAQGHRRAPVMIWRLVLVACLGTARAAGFSQSLVEQPDVSAETYTSDSGAACPMPALHTH